MADYACVCVCVLPNFWQHAFVDGSLVHKPEGG